jgi:rod shape determining protein RodA
MFKLQRLKKTNVLVLGIVIILCIVGSMNIFSTTYYPELQPSSLFFNQLIFYFVGIVVFFVLASFDFKLLNKLIFQLIIYGSTIALLFTVLFVGEEVLGARRWITIGFITIQPSEIAKLTVVLNISYIFTRLKKHKINSPKVFKSNQSDLILKLKKVFIKYDIANVMLIGFELSSIVLLVLLQRSLGNSLLIIGVFCSLVFLKVQWHKSYIVLIIAFVLGVVLNFLQWPNFLNIKFDQIDINLPLYLLSLVIICLISRQYKISKAIGIMIFLITSQMLLIGNLFYSNLQPYQQDRIDSFIGNNSDAESAINWNKQQSLIALGSGRLTGKGYLKGTQSNYKYLPFSYTDFAFAAYAEQFGYSGVLILTSLYALLFNTLIQIALKSRSNLGKYIATGSTFVLALNTFQHMGMNIGKLPITGVPLPFISYGGSSTLVAFIALGLVMSVNNSVGKESNEVKVEMKKSKYKGGNR